jgi:uncharacterized protein YhaN
LIKKTKQEIEKLKQQIAEAQALNNELAQKLEAEKQQKSIITQEMETEQAANQKLIEQKNGLQMRVDAMKKKIQDDEIRANALKEEKLRKKKLEQEAKKEAKQASVKQEKAAYQKKVDRPMKKAPLTSKTGIENTNLSQVRKTQKPVNTQKYVSSGMSELSKPPYRMKITPQLAHKAKLNK